MQIRGIGHLATTFAAHLSLALCAPSYGPEYQYANQAIPAGAVQARPLALGNVVQNLAMQMGMTPAQYQQPSVAAAGQVAQPLAFQSVLAAPSFENPAIPDTGALVRQANGSPYYAENDDSANGGFGSSGYRQGGSAIFRHAPKRKTPLVDPWPPLPFNNALGRQQQEVDDTAVEDNWPIATTAASSDDPASLGEQKQEPLTSAIRSSSIVAPLKTNVASTLVSTPTRRRKPPSSTKIMTAKPQTTTVSSKLISDAHSATPTVLTVSATIVAAVKSSTISANNVKPSGYIAPTANNVTAVTSYTSQPQSTVSPASVMRAECGKCQPAMTHAIPSQVPSQEVMGDMRQDPGSGMGYHGHKLVRGVNIGGFLVPEFWITPSLIDAIPEPKPNDYLQLCNRLGADATLQLMRKHWESWVSEAEIQRLANAGLTHLRIPIGHWEFVETSEGYVRGGLPYFKRLVYWANQYGLRVIPDMHTAPGSQNGFDNSGSTNGINWTKDPQNVAVSKRALQMMLRYIASDPVILATVDGIDLLNEPFIDSLDFEQLWDYDTGGHTLVTNGLQKVPPVISIIDRGFKEFSWWQTRWPRDWNSKYIDAFLDAHLYHVFDRNIDNWSLENHLRLVCQNGRDLKSNSTYFPIVVGEWSLALPQAAREGRENEARRRFAEAQLDAYDLGGAGWIFWCFKTEASPEWSFLDALDRSWIPQPLTSREFPSIC